MFVRFKPTTRQLCFFHEIVAFFDVCRQKLVQYPLSTADNISLSSGNMLLRSTCRFECSPNPSLVVNVVNAGSTKFFGLFETVVMFVVEKVALLAALPGATNSKQPWMALTEQQTTCMFFRCRSNSNFGTAGVARTRFDGSLGTCGDQALEVCASNCPFVAN